MSRIMNRKVKRKYKILCDTDKSVWEEDFFVVGYLKPFGYILVSNCDEDAVTIPKKTMESTDESCLTVMRMLRDSYRSLRYEEGVFNFRVALVYDDGRIEELGEEFKADPDW